MKKIKQAFLRFMMGRYGSDKLNMWILGAGFICSILSVFIPLAGVQLVLSACSTVLLIWAIFRMFSRNTYKRYQENRRFLAMLERIKDKNHRYFRCPRCRQQVRVPKGKGKIMITCPKCKEKFQKKT
jgi:hypothetical protein